MTINRRFFTEQDVIIEESEHENNSFLSCQRDTPLLTTDETTIQIVPSEPTTSHCITIMSYLHSKTEYSTFQNPIFHS